MENGESTTNRKSDSKKNECVFSRQSAQENERDMYTRSSERDVEFVSDAALKSLSCFINAKQLAYVNIHNFEYNVIKFV